MPQIILVTSFKGGVGKTTVAAALSTRLAELGNKVLICDCDLESRCLDLVLGTEDLPLFNICDVVSGRCKAEDAITTDTKANNLSFMPAPAFYPEAVQSDDTSDIFTEERIKTFIDTVSKDYDYIVLDFPARPDMLYRRLVRYADRVLVISLHTATSLRAAEKTAIAINELCADYRTPEIRLIVNGFKADDVKKGENVGLYDILSKTKIQLLGVIPYDSEMVRAQELGIPLSKHSGGKLPFRIAICNTVKRLEGLSVPLLDGIKLKVSKSSLYE